MSLTISIQNYTLFYCYINVAYFHNSQSVYSVVIILVVYVQKQNIISPSEALKGAPGKCIEFKLFGQSQKPMSQINPNSAKWSMYT